MISISYHCHFYISGGLGGMLPPIPPSTAPPYVPPSAPPIPLEGFDDLPPPTYEQAISADEGNVIQIRKICGIGFDYYTNFIQIYQ